jgi:methyl-accepting chemotaxis protein
MRFQHLRVSTRIQILVGLVLVGMLVLSGTSLVNQKTSLLEQRKEKTRQLVESVYSLINHYHARQMRGELSEEVARDTAVQAIKAMRFDGKEYFWINDLGRPVPRMVMHPTVPSLDGTLLDADKFNCATSEQAGVDGAIVKTDGRKNLFVSFVDVAEGAGRGFVTYDWPKPKEGGGTTAELFPKLSYVMKFDGWGWVVGSGIYIDDLEQVFYQQATLLIGLSVAAAALLSLLGWSIGASILRQLGGEPAEAMRIMHQIADGNLTVDLGSPPTGSLLSALASMVTSLRSLVTEINASGNRLVVDAGHIKQTAEQIASAAEQQSDATAAMVTTIEQLTVSSGQISESAQDTEHNARQEMSTAGEGKQHVITARDAIQNISGMVTDAASRIHALEVRALQVSSIANVIKEIASQTNLLALNAAIEAARAGEYGRGFAVVSDEVRKLAERTASATTEIEQMIQAIQSDTAASVEAMNNALPTVGEGVRLAGTAADLLSAIEQGASRTLDRVADIAVATREQSTAATSITRSVEEISNMTARTTANVQGAATIARELELLAQELKTRIGRFKL